MTQTWQNPLEETCTVELPAPVGTLELLASNRAFAIAKRLTRDIGVGPLDPSGRPKGIQFGDHEQWTYLDEETMPILIYALAVEHHPQLQLADVEAVCGVTAPAVMEHAGIAVLKYIKALIQQTGIRVQKKSAPARATAKAKRKRKTTTRGSGRTGPTRSNS